MKILITGATGFIGSHLVEALSDTDAEIYALVRDPGRMMPAPTIRIRVLKGDLHGVPELPAGLDIVYHLAGLTKALKSKDYYTVNAKGTASLFDALEAQGQHPKVVVLSSLAAGGPSEKGGRRKESDSPEPVTPYGRSKLGGEEEALARRDRFPVVLLRVAAVYGPRDRDFLNLFRYVEKGILPSLGSIKQYFSLCYVKDVVRALLLAGEKSLKSGEIFNIAEPEPRTLDEMGRAASAIMGLKPNPSRPGLRRGPGLGIPEHHVPQAEPHQSGQIPRLPAGGLGGGRRQSHRATGFPGGHRPGARPEGDDRLVPGERLAQPPF
jgi:dihydroflavonol-4-reductase